MTTWKSAAPADDPGVNTDRDGNVTVEDVLIPGLDPGVYSVVINVDGTIAIGEINVLAESSAAGAPAELPGAVESLGDSLVAIFHFDDVGKSGRSTTRAPSSPTSTP